MRKAYLLFFWDLPVILLIAFPLLMGGIWIKYPGLHLELTELGIPVLIVTFWGVTLKWVFNLPIENSLSARWAKKLWSRWNQAVQKRPQRTLLLGFGFISLIWSLASLRRHWAFHSGSADLGIFTNAIWNLTHGMGYISSLKRGMNLFADHQSPLFWLLAPLFYIFPHPETLLISQALGLALGGVALYFLSRQYSNQVWISSTLPLLYWSNLNLRNANLFDFHPEVFMLPLFLWALVGLQSQKSTQIFLGFLAFLGALCAKESAGPIACGIGLAWMLGAGPEVTWPFTKRLGIFMSGLGLGVFFVDTEGLPKWIGLQYPYHAEYSEVLSSTTPLLLLSHLFGAARLKFLFYTLAPLGFVPLLGWRALFASVPGYLMLFLSNGDHRVSIHYHYAIEPSVGLFWALPVGLLKLKKYSKVLLLWLLFWVGVSFGRSEIFQIRFHALNTHTQWLSQKLIPCLNVLPMATSGALVPHLSTQRWINHLPDISLPDGKSVNCLVFDPHVNNWPMNTAQELVLREKLEGLGYAKQYKCGEVEVFKLKSSAESCLRCQPLCENEPS